MFRDPPQRLLRILLPLTAASVGILLVFVIGIFRLQEANIIQDTDIKLNEVRQYWDALVAEERWEMAGVLDLLAAQQGGGDPDPSLSVAPDIWAPLKTSILAVFRGGSRKAGFSTSLHFNRLRS